jgi:hypothetical protein
VVASCSVLFDFAIALKRATTTEESVSEASQPTNLLGLQFSEVVFHNQLIVPLVARDVFLLLLSSLILTFLIDPDQRTPAQVLS